MIPKWYEIALGEIGQSEIAGDEDNPRIVEYSKTVFDYGQHDEVPWCSSFVSWCLLKAGYKSTHSALARSWLNYGDAISKPMKGDICIFRRGSESWMAHVGFFDRIVGDKYKILGGNQHNRVCMESYPASQCIGIRRPGRLERPSEMIPIEPAGKIEMRVNFLQWIKSLLEKIR